MYIYLRTFDIVIFLIILDDEDKTGMMGMMTIKVHTRLACGQQVGPHFTPPPDPHTISLTAGLRGGTSPKICLPDREQGISAPNPENQ